MKIIEKLRSTPYLAQSLFAYLLLAFTDMLHHLHAAMALGDENAVYAVWIGVFFVPIAMLSLLGFIIYSQPRLVWLFGAISLLAAFVPGIYHGGWEHIVKILTHLVVEGESTNINLLFPADNVNFWIYEISGSLEFFLAIFVIYFLTRMFLVNSRR